MYIGLGDALQHALRRVKPTGDATSRHDTGGQTVRLNPGNLLPKCYSPHPLKISWREDLSEGHHRV
jgi:hypothetical protein